MTRDQIEAGRRWIADCTWANLEPEDIEDLSDAAIIRGIARHYDGGIAQFVQDGG
jgi:hypothetical protein